MLRYKGVNANAQSAASHQQRQNNGGHLDPFLLHILSTSFLLRHPGGAFVYELLPHFLGNGFVCGYGGHIGFDLRLRAGGAHDQLAAVLRLVFQHIGFGQINGGGFWRRWFMIPAIFSIPASPSKV